MYKLKLQDRKFLVIFIFLTKAVPSLHICPTPISLHFHFPAAAAATAAADRSSSLATSAGSSWRRGTSAHVRWPGNEPRRRAAAPGADPQHLEAEPPLLVDPAAVRRPR